jgi:hypothetical protein
VSTHLKTNSFCCSENQASILASFEQHLLMKYLGNQGANQNLLDSTFQAIIVNTLANTIGPLLMPPSHMKP